MRFSRQVLLVLGAMFAFSLMALFTRRAGVPFLTVAAYRAVIVALVFGVWAVVGSPEGMGALRVDRTTLRHGAVYGLALAVASSTFVGGYAFTTVANTIFLHNLAPLAAFPLAWWAFRERPAPNAITGAGLAIIGVGLMSGVSLFHLGHFSHPRFVLGDALALLSAVGYAGVLVMTRATRRAETPILPTLFVAWSVAAVLIALIALLAGSLAIDLVSLLWIAGLAVVCTNLPFFLLNVGMKKVSAGMASVLSQSEVLFATVLGWLVFGEVLAPIGWLGGGLVLVGVLYALSTPRETSEEEPVDALSQTGHLVRLGRLGVALVVLNLAAVHAILGGSGAGALLAWLVLAGMLRLGQAPLLALAGSRRRGWLSWAGAALAGLVVAGLLFRGGWSEPGVSGFVVLLAGLAWLADRWLAGWEPPGERDRPLLWHASLACVALGQIFAHLHHWGERVFTGAAVLAGALGAGALAVDGLRGMLPWPRAPEHAGSARADARLARRVTPRRGLAVVVLLYLLGGVRQIPLGNRAVVERLGRPLEQLLTPGLTVRLPPPLDRVVQVDVSSVQRLVLVDTDTPLLCGEHALLTVSAVLHHRISDPIAYIYNAEDPERELRNIGRAALVATVSHLSQDAVLTYGRNEVERKVRSECQRIVSRVGLGVEILDVHLARTAVPAPVLDSFLDVISAREEKQTRINQARAYAARVLPEAFGEAVARNRAAEGEALRIAARAEGRVARLRAQAEGAAIHEPVTRERLRFEALERALRDRRLVLVPPGLRVWLGGEPDRTRDPAHPSEDTTTGGQDHE